MATRKLGQMSQTGLNSEQKVFYDTNGYILVKGLFSKDEASAYRKRLHQLADRLGNPDATWASVKSGDTRLTHCHDVQFKDAAFTKMLVDPRFTSIASDIVGPDVELHHTKMFIKPPEKGSPFPMHQDYPYFPHENHSMIAAIVHFDDAPVEKGCLRVIPGSHKMGPLEAFGSDHTLPQYPVEDALPVPAEAGDAIFMHYLLIHGSGINVSTEARTTILVQMRDPMDRPLNNRHASRGQGMMLSGVDRKNDAQIFAWEADAR
jgi:ectoine hydroxylase-related dioxygenase (phytanoyl-CoA dioxygenase family)